jgi:hypothetical protein
VRELRQISELLKLEVRAFIDEQCGHFGVEPMICNLRAGFLLRSNLTHADGDSLGGAPIVDLSMCGSLQSLLLAQPDR